MVKIFNNDEEKKFSDFRLRDELKDTVNMLEEKLENTRLEIQELYSKETLLEIVNAPEDKKLENKKKIEVKTKKLDDICNDLEFNKLLKYILDTRIDIKYLNNY
ncbi:hypothetical protein QQF12_05480 [Clostridium perfringens]|uniref:hypothetical protein n=1 Tax=Clostridium perfringens TaxID=1502 RepID=UPI0037497223